MDKQTHGGKRTGAGRKPAPFPVQTKKFRATNEEWRELLGYLSGDARKDFELIYRLLRTRNLLKEKES